MAIFHLSAKPIQRSKGRSATSAAAYRAGVCLSDERTGETHDYTKKQGVEHTELITPTGEDIDREKLWNLAESAEKRKDGTTAREYEIALPDELAQEERKALVQEFGKYLAEQHGCAVDIAIHEPNRKGDQRNHHAHILCTTRQFQPGGELGAKCDVELSDRDRQKKNLPGRKVELDATRAQWAHLVNAALERAGHLERVSHESLEKQGIEREPTNHLGPAATAMERRGERTYLGNINRQVLTFNVDLAAIRAIEADPTPKSAPVSPLASGNAERQEKEENQNGRFFVHPLPEPYSFPVQRLSEKRLRKLSECRLTPPQTHPGGQSIGTELTPSLESVLVSPLASGNAEQELPSPQQAISQKEIADGIAQARAAMQRERQRQQELREKQERERQAARQSQGPRMGR